MKALLLNSGGLDTLVSAKKAIVEGWELHSLYIYLGQQNHLSAVQFARQIADDYCLTHNEIEVSGAPYLTDENFLHVPFQSLVVSSLGIMYARTNGLDYIVTGLKNDAYGSDFHTHLSSIINSSLINSPITFILPVVDLLRVSDVYHEGIRLGIPHQSMEKTVSCNHEKPCKKFECVKCRQRSELGL